MAAPRRRTHPTRPLVLFLSAVVAAWRAIVTAPGGPGEEFPMEKAIAIQIACIDRLNAHEDLDAVPTYGRPPAPAEGALTQAD